MNVIVDQNSKYCFGVNKAINLASEYLSSHNYLYCLGDIIHNPEEVSRLKKMGLITINHKEFEKLRGETVLIRAHGEVVKTYETARKNNINLVDATCPIVKSLQQQVREYASKYPDHQIIIFGKETHPESIGLASRANNMVFITQNADNVPIDFSRPAKVFSQTTMDSRNYEIFISTLKELFKARGHGRVFPSQSLCKYVSNRVSQVRQFAKAHDVILFVSGKDSSNGKYLFDQVLDKNKNSHFITKGEDIDPVWLDSARSAGITGAVSTPPWLLERVKSAVIKLKKPDPTTTG